MTVHGTLFTDFPESTSSDPFVLQNKKLLKLNMEHGPVQVRAGSMVAYQGDVRFTKQSSGGMSKMVKKAVSGEGAVLMTCEGTGEVFVADMASEIQVIYLQDDWVSVNGANVLGFSASISWDIQRMGSAGAGMAGGMYNVILQGTGYVAITTHGDPVALDVASAPTFVDPNAFVLWSSGVEMSVKTDLGGISSMLRGGTGEMFQLAFTGSGYVIVQPAENVGKGGGQAASTGSGSAGGMLGGLLK